MTPLCSEGRTSIHRASALAWGFCLMFAGIAGADGDPMSDVMARLKSIDSVYLSGYTLRGRARLPQPAGPDVPPTPGKEPPKVSMTWAFTSDGARHASILEADGPPLPDFTTPPPGASGPPDAHGTPVLGVIAEIDTLYDSDRSAQLQSHAVFKQGPAGKIIETGRSRLVQVFAPDSPDLSVPVKQALWGSGRGYSPYLDEVTKISQGEGGLISVVAKGRESPNSIGTWELKVDPSSSFLVREASFTQRGADGPTFSIRNEGIKVSGPCQFPSRISWTLKLGYDETTEFEVEAGSLSFDADLFRKVRARVVEPYPPNSAVLDHRTLPMEPFRVDASGSVQKPPPARPSPNPGPPAARSRWTALLLMGLNLLALAAFLSWRFLRRQKNLGFLR